MYMKTFLMGLQMVISSTGCSSIVHRFDSQHLYGGSQMSVHPVPEIRHPLLISTDTEHTGAHKHTFRQNIHTDIIKKNHFPNSSKSEVSKPQG